MASGNSILQELLGDIAASCFFEHFYLKTPLARSAETAAWRHIADHGVISRLLQHPQVDVIVGRAGERWPDGTPRPEDIPAILAQGYTIGLRHVDRYDDNLSALSCRFHEAFHAPIDVHLYCTPADHTGFGWHYDAEEVFVLQAHGSKQWWLRKNTVNPWPLIDNLPADQRYEREIMPALNCRLCEGDWLYIPGGYWHRTQADSESISLSVGVRAWTALDVFDALRPALAESLLWRQRLPRLERDLELKELVVVLASDLTRQFQDDGFQQRFIDRFRNSRH